ncbi:MAG: cation:proton antiporter family protein, partial [Balneolaceae bacterium]
EISHVGVIFLLFTVGLHVRLRNIVRSEVLGVGILHLIISAAIFIPVSLAFGFDLPAAVTIGLTLGFSSTVLAAKNLEMRNEMGAYYGRVTIGILIVQDLVAIAIIALTGGGAPSYWSVLLFGLPFLRPVLSTLLDWIDKDELILLFGMVLAIGGASLFEQFNLSGELGALVAGMILATDERGEDLGRKMWGIKEAFLIGFFLEVGLIGFPAANGFYFILVMLALLPLKSILFYGLFMLFRLRARTGYLATISLTAYSEFTLIAGAVAAANGVIPESVIVILGLLTALSFVINAPLAIREDKLWKKFEVFFHRFELDVRHPEKQTLSIGKAEFLVIGMGSAGRAAYDRLRKEGKQVVGMDIDPGRIEENLKAGRRVVYGDIQDTELWSQIALKNIKSIIIAMGNRGAKVNASKAIRDMGYTGSIYVITMREDENEALQKAGANSVSIPIRQAGEQLAELSIESADNPDPLPLQVNKPE